MSFWRFCNANNSKEQRLDEPVHATSEDRGEKEVEEKLKTE